MENENINVPEENPEQEEQQTHTAREIELMNENARLQGELEAVRAENQRLFVKFAGGNADDNAPPSIDDVIMSAIKGGI